VPDSGPFAEPTTDVAGRGRGAVAPQPSYITDRAQPARPGDSAYVPAPALPTLHPSAPPADGRNSGFPGLAGRNASGAAYPGQARSSVTTPEATGITRAADGEQGRFDAFKPDAADASADRVEAPPNVRKLPVLILVLLVSALLVGGALGIVWLLARPSSGFDVNVGQCVKQNGDTAVTANCGDPGSFEVVSKVDTKEQCADPDLPHVVNPAGSGRSQVLCLKASS
jgi:hypothetical protein